MTAGYFHRVTQETPTRFWINNPNRDEVEKALDAGAICCTTNPTYGSKLLKTEPEYAAACIDRALTETEDEEAAAELVCEEVTSRLMARFLPLYERSGGRQGFVTLQDDPRKEEDWTRIVEMALRYRKLGPNFMTKIPVTEAGLRAIETLVAENIPICATEIFALDQVVAVCDAYRRASEKSGHRPPFYVTHITGIFDEYLSGYVQEKAIHIAPDRLAWAGFAVGQAEYRLLKSRGLLGTMLGGGARSTRHFTDFVGGDIHITINWSTAQELIEADPPVAPHIETVVPAEVVAELREKLPDVQHAITLGSLPVEEFETFGPVVLFRNRFIAGYEHLLEEVALRRAATSEEKQPALARQE